MAEIRSHIPEDIIEQEGPNRGAIKDKDLAQIGAEAEKDFREKPAEEQYGFKIPPEAVNPKAVAITADEIAEDAIADEVNKRALDPGTRFKIEQDRLSSERKKD